MVRRYKKDGSGQFESISSEQFKQESAATPGGTYNPSTPRNNFGGGTSAGFENLAKQRGVDLQAEQQKAYKQIISGQQIGGTAQETTDLQASMSSELPNKPGVQDFQAQALDPFSQGIGVSQAPLAPLITEQQPYFQAKIQQIKAEGNKPLIGINGEPIELKELSPFDALALVNVPIKTSVAKAAIENIDNIALRYIDDIGTGAVKNSKNIKLISSAAAKASSKVFWKVVGALGLATFVAEKVLTLTYGGRNFGQFLGQEEAAQGLNMATNAAYYAGNEEAYNIAAEARDEVLGNNEFWSNTEGLMPYANTKEGLESFREAAITQGKVMDLIARDKFAAEKEGLDEAQQWAAAKAEQLENERANIDYYNQERLRIDNLIREAEKNQRNEDAAFWLEQKRKTAELEKKEREEIQKFWLEYFKMKQKLQQNNSPSKLNFGLI